jgi:hypothetical protein
MEEVRLPAPSDLLPRTLIALRGRQTEHLQDKTTANATVEFAVQLHFAPGWNFGEAQLYSGSTPIWSYSLLFKMWLEAFLNQPRSLS